MQTFKNNIIKITEFTWQKLHKYQNRKLIWKKSLMTDLKFSMLRLASVLPSTWPFIWPRHHYLCLSEVSDYTLDTANLKFLIELELINNKANL